MHAAGGWITPPALHAIDRGQQVRRNAAAPFGCGNGRPAQQTWGYRRGDIDWIVWALAGPPTASNVTTARQNHRMGGMIAAKP